MTGPKGDRGDRGDTGMMGVQGQKGEMGVQGGIHFHTFSVLVYRAMLREMIFEKNHCFNIVQLVRKGSPDS